MRISRRTMIGGSLAITGVAALGGYRLLAPLGDREAAIARFIARQVPELEADDPAVTDFAIEAVPHAQRSFANFDKHIVLMENPLLARALPQRQAGYQSDFERLLVTWFMRSTDLLLDRAAGAPVSFIAFADPYSAGCSNPLARLG